MTINSTFIIYGVAIPVKDIYPLVVGPISDEEKDDESDIMSDWMYNIEEIGDFFVVHVPHDQCNNEPTVVVGIKICEIELNIDDCSVDKDLLTAMKKSVTVEADYRDILSKFNNKQLKQLLSSPSLLQVNDDCGCCS